MINSFNGSLKRERGGRLITTKPDASNHGIGLKSIQKAVEMYNGIMHIDSNENIFTLKILLYGK